MSLRAVLSAAIEIAEEGFEVSVELADSLTRLQPRLEGQASAAWMYPDGDPPVAGAAIRRPDHAGTLRRLISYGRDAFYLDALGTALTELTEGLVTQDDLAVVQSEWIHPIKADIVDQTGWTTPPNSQGHLTLSALWIAERLVGSADPDDPLFQHVLIESYRAAAEDRDDITTEPRTAPLAPDAVLSPDRLAAKLHTVDLQRAVPMRPLRAVPGGTMHLVARDAAGMGVSLIQSNFHGIGTARSIDGSGVFLHNRGAGFTLEPGHPNELVAGHRPLHTLSPTLWTNPGDGNLSFLLGTRGGQYQPQLLLQVMARVLFAGQSLADAVAAPRWVVDNWNGPAHAVQIEGADDVFCDQLRSRGHAVTTVERWRRGWGPIAAIEIDSGNVQATGDPRVTTSGVASTRG